MAPSLAEHYTAERLPLPCHLPRPPPTPQLSRLVPRAAKPLSIRRITTYSAAWVRSQSRMSSVSNQETWRWVGEWVGGRVGGWAVGGSAGGRVGGLDVCESCAEACWPACLEGGTEVE